MKLILRTKNLVKHFDGVCAIDNLSINIERGTVTSIVGPNGSGKTTLVNILCGLLRPDRGEIELSDVRFHEFRSEEMITFKVTRTFQEVRLFNQMSVLDNILVVLTERSARQSFFEKHGEFHLERAKKILGKVDLWEKRNELAGSLSYGQRKLLEIGRMLAIDAKLVLLDEPFAGLFPEMVKIIVNIVKDLKAHEVTVILIEHDMSLVRELSDHVIVMDSGKLLAEGKPDEVLKRRDVIEAYLGE